MNLIKGFIFFAFGISLLLNALLFVPQIIKIYKEKTAAGFSKTTFVGFCTTQLIAIIYGCFTHDWILAAGYGVALLTCGTVTILIFIYSEKKPDESQ